MIDCVRFPPKWDGYRCWGCGGAVQGVTVALGGGSDAITMLPCPRCAIRACNGSGGHKGFQKEF